MTDEQWKAFDKWPKGICIDPHSAKSFFIGWFAVNPRNEIIFFHEFPFAPFYETKIQLGTKGYVEQIEAIERGDNSFNHPFMNVLWRLMDPNFGPAPSTHSGQSLQEDFAEFGMWFDCAINDDLHTRHILVRDRLDKGTIAFTPNCQNLIEAMERYIHKKGRRDTEQSVSEKVEEAYKDGADVVGYTVIFDPRWISTDPPKQTELEDMGI